MRKILFVLSLLAILSACNGSAEAGSEVVADSIPVAGSVEVVDTTAVHQDSVVTEVPVGGGDAGQLHPIK
jgi:hypothetical protein